MRKLIFTILISLSTILYGQNISRIIAERTGEEDNILIGSGLKAKISGSSIIISGGFFSKQGFQNHQADYEVISVIDRKNGIYNVKDIYDNSTYKMIYTSKYIAIYLSSTDVLKYIFE